MAGYNGDFKDFLELADNKKKDSSAEKRFVKILILQIVICILIVLSIIIIRFFSPDKYTYVVSGIGLINKENITLSDLNTFLDQKVRENDSLSVFFNVEGVSDAETTTADNQ